MSFSKIKTSLRFSFLKFKWSLQKPSNGELLSNELNQSTSKKGDTELIIDLSLVHPVDSALFSGRRCALNRENSNCRLYSAKQCSDNFAISALAQNLKFVYNMKPVYLTFQNSSLLD